jgi:hypothetical protein
LPGEKCQHPIDKGNNFCQESAWSHIKHDWKGIAAPTFHHVIVYPYLVTKNQEEEPGKLTNEVLLRLRWFSIKLNDPEARIQAFDPSKGSGNGKVSEE